MQLIEVDPNDSRGLVREWYFGSRPYFMRSGAYDILTGALASYVRDEIPGRSFLIAAHRGVGKTSLVLRAVEDLNRAIVLAAAQGTLPVGSGSRGSRPTPQRPLLVKLHGTALISTPTPAGWARPSAAAPKASAETALPQIAIALYRALADEIAKTFALHAIEAGRQPAQRELPEMAAQLRLDLDLAPDPAALRGYWARALRLDSGVLWPSAVGEQLTALGLVDRGMREIVAVVTANQAFQVCAGRVEASQTAKGSAERIARMESATRLDAKDAANKLFGLTAGALVGGALLQSAGGTGAAAAGLGAALLSTFALGWASERRQRSERSTDYTFILDSSLQTLDRDLPKVIDRIREAGLAPVFLIDELDKLDEPGQSIEEIVKRLKSLTTDYGFFCFLTDRSYFEEIEARLRTTAFPKQHTLFGRRLLLVYRPAEMAFYVRTLWTTNPEQPFTDPGHPFDSEAAWVLTCVVLHRARLNTMDVRRELVRLCHADGMLRPDPAVVATDAFYLVPMAVQLAIEHIMRQAEIRARIEADDTFAQLAIDVLYMISRAWDEGKTKIVIDETTVYQDLIDRRCADLNNAALTAEENSAAKAAEQAAAKAALDATATPEDIDTLTTKLLRLARLLTFFPGIYTAINSEPRFPPLPSAASLPPFADTADSEGSKLITLGRLLTSIPAVAQGLLREADSAEPDGTFYFLFDRYGVAYVRWDEALADMRDGVRLFDELRDALAPLSMDIGLLVSDIGRLLSAGVLPPTLDAVALEQSAARLRPVRDIGALQIALREDIDRLAGLTSALRQFRRAIVGTVALVSRILQDVRGVRPEPPPDAAFSAINRMLGLGPLVAMLSAPPGTAPPLQSLKSPNSPVVAALLSRPDESPAGAAMTWGDEIAAEFSRQTGLLAGPNQAAAPDAWQERLARWLLHRARPVDPPIGYHDLVQAAAGAFPAADLRPDFDTMTITEWSRFANTALAQRETWAFAAGLRALGFGQGVLAAADAGRFAEGAPPDRPGLWMVFAPNAEIVAPPDPAGIPVVFVTAQDESAYQALKDWLTDNDALAAEARKED